MLKCFLVAHQTGKNLPAMWRPQLDRWIEKIPLEKGKGLPTPGFLSDNSMTQEPGSATYSPWGRRARHELSNYHCAHFHVKSFLQICGNPYFLIIKIERLPS